MEFNTLPYRNLIGKSKRKLVNFLNGKLNYNRFDNKEEKLEEVGRMLLELMELSKEIDNDIKSFKQIMIDLTEENEKYRFVNFGKILQKINYRNKKKEIVTLQVRDLK